MTIGLFIRRLMVFVILLCLLPTGTWEDMNGGHHPTSEAHDPSAEGHHFPSWLVSDAAPTCPTAGDSSASGDIVGCQADLPDQITYLLFEWFWVIMVAYYLGLWMNHAFILFKLLVVYKMMARAGQRLRPPAPVVADDNAEGPLAANLVEPASIAPVLAGGDNVEGGPAILVEPAKVGPVLADDDAGGGPADLAENAPGTAENVPGAAGEAKTDAEVEASSIVIAARAVSGSSAAAATSTPAALSLRPGRRPHPPMPLRSVSLPEPLIAPPAVTSISGDFTPRARANTIGHLSFATACIIDGGNGRGQ